MAKEIKVAAQKRTAGGSSGARRVRREGWVPAVVCTDKGQSESIQINAHDFEMMLHHQQSENVIIDLTVGDGLPRKVLLREVQHHPVSGGALHVDFVEISMTRKMRVAVPVRLIGEPVGVSQEGGLLEHILRELHVECLPGDLMESIDVDVSALKLGQSTLVRDLKVDPKITILTTGDIAVARVAAPRKEEEVAAAETAVAAEGAEPEVITARKEKEGEEGAAEGAAPAKGAAAKGAAAPAKGAPAKEAPAPAKKEKGKGKAE